MMNSFKVAVVCYTYNHKDYISEAIDSFLAQITDFDYQIVIHDDCSTDGTVDLLKSYAVKYPEKVFLILQETNLYSKGLLKTSFSQIKDLINADFVATCEGDDYWIDNYKLQKQVSFLEENSDFSASAHWAKIYNEKSKKFVIYKPYISKIITTHNMILEGGGIVPTSSILVRSEFYNLPPFGINSQIGDYQSQIYYSLMGNVNNSLEYMSVYRQNTPGSWTDRFKQSSNEKKISFLNEMLDLYDELNLFTEGNYEQIINYMKFVTGLKKFIIGELYSKSVYRYKFEELFSATSFVNKKCLLIGNMYLRKFCGLYFFTKNLTFLFVKTITNKLRSHIFKFKHHLKIVDYLLK